MQIVSYLAMLACILLFIYINTQRDDPAYLAIKMGAIYPPKIRNGEYWRFIAAGFIHVQVYHILANMYSLYNFRWLERFLGSGRYALVLLVSIVAGNLLAYRFSKDNHITFGISGGIFTSLDGGNFGNGFISSAISSGIGSFAQGVKMGQGLMIGATTLIGGFSAGATGGDFFQGAMQGMQIGLLNHASHDGDGGIIYYRDQNGNIYGEIPEVVVRPSTGPARP